MSLSFKVVIPARHASTRLPGKPLLSLAGRSMLHHVFERAQQSGADEVIIATDDLRIESAAVAFNAKVCMTSSDHTSGTERIGEVVASLGWSDEAIVVNLQGDEPLMPPELIGQVAVNLSSHQDASMATLAYPLMDIHEFSDPNIVKVVLDRRGYALYFSRAGIPCWRNPDAGQEGAGTGRIALRHIGLYAYRAGFLRRFGQLERSPLEEAEKLEQLRVLWHGQAIHVGIAEVMPGPGVDTREDLARVEGLLRKQ